MTSKGTFQPKAFYDSTIKWQEMKQDIDPAQAEGPASLTWFAAAPSLL